MNQSKPDMNVYQKYNKDLRELSTEDKHEIMTHFTVEKINFYLNKRNLTKKQIDSFKDEDKKKLSVYLKIEKLNKHYEDMQKHFHAYSLSMEKLGNLDLNKKEDLKTAELMFLYSIMQTEGFRNYAKQYKNK